MAHNVESMMYAGTPPWHGLGVAVPREVTSVEALAAAGLDWEVATAPLLVDGSSPDDKARVEGWKAVVRLSDGRGLGVVGERYRPIQNKQAFAFFDALVGEGQAIYHTAGSLNGGRKVWVLAKLPGEIRVADDDVTEKYLLLSNSHDGSTALRMFFTPVRVVCQNTLNLALREGATDGISIRHTTSATVKLEEARRALGIATSYYDRFAEQAARFAASPYDEDQLAVLTAVLFPATDDEVSARRLKAREKVIELFEYGKGHDGIRGTAWAALNAVAEFTDHHRLARGSSDAARAEGRLNSTWFGSGAALKRRAFEMISQQLAA